MTDQIPDHFDFSDQIPVPDEIYANELLNVALNLLYKSQESATHERANMYALQSIATTLIALQSILAEYLPVIQSLCEKSDIINQSIQPKPTKEMEK